MKFCISNHFLALIAALGLFCYSPALLHAQGGYTLDFDGTDDYVQIPYAAALNPALFTIEVWAKVEGGAGTFRSVITSRNGTNPSQGYMLYAAGNNTWQFWTGNGGNGTWDNVLSGVAVTDAWTHIAASFDGTSVRMYINGELKATTAVTYIQNTARNVRIGTGVTEASPSYYFPGKIDEVRIWSDVRSQAEIQANMHKSLTDAEANLEGYYKMSDGSGATLTDNSANSHDGTLTNGPAWKTSGALAGPGMALELDGVNDAVVSGSNITLTGNAARTVEFWVMPLGWEAGSGYTSILSYEAGGGTNRGFGAAFLGDRRIAVSFFNNSIISTTSATLSTWYHVAMTYDGTTRRIYINGNLENTNTPAGVNTDAAPLQIGRWGACTLCGDGYGNIRIDEIRFWNDARTEAEVRANMYRTLDADEAGLLHYYRFDQQPHASHTTLHDQTANGNHGTLTNMDAATDWVASTPFNTWIGSENSDWSNADNWSRGAAPSCSAALPASAAHPAQPATSMRLPVPFAKITAARAALPSPSEMARPIRPSRSTSPQAPSALATPQWVSPQPNIPATAAPPTSSTGTGQLRAAASAASVATYRRSTPTATSMARRATCTAASGTAAPGPTSARSIPAAT